LPWLKGFHTTPNAPGRGTGGGAVGDSQGVRRHGQVSGRQDMLTTLAGPAGAPDRTAPPPASREFSPVGPRTAPVARGRAGGRGTVAVVPGSARLVDSESHRVRTGAADRGGSSGAHRRQKGAVLR